MFGGKKKKKKLHQTFKKKTIFYFILCHRIQFPCQRKYLEVLGCSQWFQGESFRIAFITLWRKGDAVWTEETDLRLAPAPLLLFFLLGTADWIGRQPTEGEWSYFRWPNPELMQGLAAPAGEDEEKFWCEWIDKCKFCLGFFPFRPLRV